MLGVYTISAMSTLHVYIPHLITHTNRPHQHSSQQKLYNQWRTTYRSTPLHCSMLPQNTVLDYSQKIVLVFVLNFHILSKNF